MIGSCSIRFSPAEGIIIVPNPVECVLDAEESIKLVPYLPTEIEKLMEFIGFRKKKRPCGKAERFL